MDDVLCDAGIKQSLLLCNERFLILSKKLDICCQTYPTFKNKGSSVSSRQLEKMFPIKRSWGGTKKKQVSVL